MQLTASAEGTDSLTVDAVATPTKKEVSGSSENSFETIEEQEADCKWNRLLYLSGPQMSDNMYITRVGPDSVQDYIYYYIRIIYCICALLYYCM